MNYCYELTARGDSRTLMISPPIFQSKDEAYREGNEQAMALAETGAAMPDVWAFPAKNAAGIPVVGIGGAA